jgi:hypothetical protein
MIFLAISQDNQRAITNCKAFSLELRLYLHLLSSQIKFLCDFLLGVSGFFVFVRIIFFLQDRPSVHEAMASEDSTDGSPPYGSLLKEDDYDVIVNNLIDDYFGVPREEEKAENENEKKTASLDPVLEKVASASNDDLRMISAGVTRRETEELQESRTESTSEASVNQVNKESEANLIDDYQKKYCGVAQKDPNDPFLESEDCSSPEVRKLTEEVCEVIVNSLLDDFRTYFLSIRLSMASEDSTDGSTPDVGQLTEENREVIVNQVIIDFCTHFLHSTRPSMASEDSTDSSSPDVGQLAEANNEVIAESDYGGLKNEEKKADNENEKGRIASWKG